MDLEAATACQGVNWATTPATVGSPQSGQQATSPGISGQTEPPPPVTLVSPRKAMSPAELQAAARTAVSQFIEAKYGPNRNMDKKKVEMLKSRAECVAEENWLLQYELDPNNLEKQSDAQRLLRQALETKQGRAEISQDILTKKFAGLFVMEQGLKRGLDDPRGKPLTEQEKRNVRRIIWEAEVAADENNKAWIVARDNNSRSHFEPYGDAMLCKAGVESAQNTKDRTRTLVNNAEFYVTQLDRRARHPATKNP